MHISDDEDLAAGLVSNSKRPSNASLVKDYLALMAGADNPTTAGRAASFVSLTDGKVYVEFDTINRRLRRRVLESVARERHGEDAVRILRLLLDVGKMDEKQVRLKYAAHHKPFSEGVVQIAKVAMLANKDVRPLLSVMSSDCLISTQEIPKSADHNPTRTFYLWYVFPPRLIIVKPIII